MRPQQQQQQPQPQQRTQGVTQQAGELGVAVGHMALPLHQRSDDAALQGKRGTSQPLEAGATSKQRWLRLLCTTLLRPSPVKTLPTTGRCRCTHQREQRLVDVAGLLGALLHSARAAGCGEDALLSVV